MRDTAKHIVERAIRAAGLARLALHRRRTETIVLAYHNIVPEGEVARGDTSLHLPQRLFARQLDLLRETHTIIPLSELTAPHDDTRPRAVITFDDAYRGAVTAGVTELARRGLPATIFVAPAFVGGGSFWWDEFANDSGLPAELRERALSSLRGEDERVRTWADGAKLPRQTVPSHETVASEAELHAAVANGSITLGSHTWSHPNLATVSREDVDVQLRSSRHWLETRFAAFVPWISYPYGLHSTEVESIAAACGYSGGFLINGGWLQTSMLTSRPFSLPRLNVPAGLSPHGFHLRTSGLF